MVEVDPLIGLRGLAATHVMIFHFILDMSPPELLLLSLSRSLSPSVCLSHSLSVDRAATHVMIFHIHGLNCLNVSHSLCLTVSLSHILSVSLSHCLTVSLFPCLSVSLSLYLGTAYIFVSSGVA